MTYQSPWEAGTISTVKSGSAGNTGSRGDAGNAGNPLILVKCDLLREDRPDRFDGYARAVECLPELGIDGVEVAVRIRGEEERDHRAIDRVVEWTKRWYDAGLHVDMHPYTGGAANPAQCAELDGGIAHAAFRLVADTAARLAERGKAPMLLTYHAAETSKPYPDIESARPELLARSERFFDLAFAYAESLGLVLVSETQLPPTPDEQTIRIADRPDEVIRTLGGRPLGACLDTGHYLLAVERLGLPFRPDPALISAVRHMHIHDVADHKDHRPLGPHSRRVAAYVAMVAATGHLRSITLEYNYLLDADAQGESDEERTLDHLRRVVPLVREWSSMDPAELEVAES